MIPLSPLADPDAVEYGAEIEAVFGFYVERGWESVL